MATHQIEVDAEVFAHLQERARPLVDSANDVLRRLLLLERAGAETKIETRRPGNLARLVDAGLIKDGDRLTHTRKRTGQTYHAIVTADGWLELPNEPPFSAPSPALKKCVGTDIDGNKNWTHDASGKTLRQLLDTLESSSV
jgi:Restriction Enzyme Adenine Methylase Associated